MENNYNAIFEVTNRCLIIKPGKELDHHNAVTLRDKSDKLIVQGNVKNVIFNFENVTFMDSSGIGVIMGRYKKVVFTGGKVAVTNVSETVDRIFHLSGIYKIIDKYNSVQEAVKAL